MMAASAIGVFTLALVVPFVEGPARWFFAMLTIALFAGAIWEFGSVPFRKRLVRDHGDRLRHEAVTTMDKALREYECLLEDWRDAAEQLDLLTRWGESHERA
ncbi:hypothetical protein [Streptomyces sp. ML-6]|uniref:hypothetical protein n=1 Tax=Streptomyces sp. ML-6 TaxID=2982693 RepID=UPI0024BF253E|nr:hypothetical protein [Streptomyces sp. ML-6]MDK0520441.1 hypothetical protein [Streptomyces sp. ML-6]